jgi:hypothetical protein
MGGGDCMSKSLGIWWMAVIVIGSIGFILALSYGARFLNNAATPITVYEVEDGIKCAAMVTSDGAALSCWKIQSSN